MKSIETIIASNDDVSAHLLGIDGWLLRTIPSERRNIFLKLYEKALRTALHPDVIQDAAKKKFYEGYIGRVAESVAAMCEDAAVYDTMAEFVPAAKSRVVSMESLVSERDAQIDALRAEMKDMAAAFKKESEHFSRTEAANKNSAKQSARLSAATHEVFTKFKAVAENSQSHSIWLKFFKITGNLTRINFTDDGVKESTGEQCELVKNTAKTLVSGIGKVSIVGATTIGGLKHCRENGRIANAAMESLIETFSPVDCSDYSLQLKHYIVGFFKVGMLLIVNDGEKNTLIEIKAIDAIDEKSKEKIMLLKETIERQDKKIASLQKAISRLKENK